MKNPTKIIANTVAKLFPSPWLPCFASGGSSIILALGAFQLSDKNREECIVHNGRQNGYSIGSSHWIPIIMEDPMVVHIVSILTDTPLDLHPTVA